MELITVTFIYTREPHLHGMGNIKQCLIFVCSALHSYILLKQSWAACIAGNKRGGKLPVWCTQPRRGEPGNRKNLLAQEREPTCLCGGERGFPLQSLVSGPLVNGPHSMRSPVTKKLNNPPACFFPCFCLTLKHRYVPGELHWKQEIWQVLGTCGILQDLHQKCCMNLYGLARTSTSSVIGWIFSRIKISGKAINANP